MTQRVKRRERKRRQAARLAAIWELVFKTAREMQPLKPGDYIFRDADGNGADSKEKT